MWPGTCNPLIPHLSTTTRKRLCSLRQGLQQPKPPLPPRLGCSSPGQDPTIMSFFPAVTLVPRREQLRVSTVKRHSYPGGLNDGFTVVLFLLGDQISQQGWEVAPRPVSTVDADPKAGPAGTAQLCIPLERACSRHLGKVHN